MRPLLSICIPTKNRSKHLDQCLGTIFGLPHYDSSLVEVVVSDNASSDDTPHVVDKYVASQRNVVYGRNEANLGGGGELNFIKALSMANGRLLKLLNDYTILTDDALAAYLDFADKYAVTRPSAIFLQSKAPSHIQCATMDDFVREAEWNLTWIGSHVYWKESWDRLADKEQALQSKLIQLDWCLRLFDESKPIHVIRGDFFRNMPLASNKVDYNWFEVHTTKFFSVLRPYVESGAIRQDTFDTVKHILYKSMCHSIKIRCFQQTDNISIPMSEVVKVFETNYREYWWFYPRFYAYLAKLYIKRWTGYWWLQRKIKTRKK